MTHALSEPCHAKRRCWSSQWSGCAMAQTTKIISTKFMASCSKHHHASDALAFVHQIKSLVDVTQRHHVGDHRVDLDLAIHVPIDDFRHVGAPARAAEGGALPHSPAHKLEWPR